MLNEDKNPGIIIINKHTGISSQSVVNRVKRLLGVKKAGHTGTLDPLATGVLPVLLERGVKASEYLLTESKHYNATLLLGIETDTEDITGEVLKRSCDIPAEKEVMKAVSEFVGKIKQTPPMYSAIKIDGKKLYELAREGKTIERASREVEIYSLQAKRLSETEYTLNIHCSKGTYIRTLCADIGTKLGCGGVMKTLTRTEAAGFTLEDAVTLDELEGLCDEKRNEHVIPLERAFSDLPKVTLPDFFARLAHSGLEIYISKIGISIEEGKRVMMCDKEGFFAIGEVKTFADGLAIKPIKQFKL